MACSNVCAFARNGVCDDGGELARRGPPPVGTHIFAPAAAHVVLRCAWGTDCDDCGPREERALAFAPLHDILSDGHGASPAAVSGGAMQHPLDANGTVAGMQVRAAWTATQPPFIMTYTDPRDEFGVSRSMDSGLSLIHI